LVHIDNPDEQDRITHYLRSGHALSEAYYWIGLHESNDDGHWRWEWVGSADSTDAHYFNWKTSTGQPNDEPIGSSGSQDCAALSSNQNDRKWFDTDCYDNFAYYRGRRSYSIYPFCESGPIISIPGAENVSTTPAPELSDYQYPIRLVGGSTPNEGRLEIFYHGEWGTVCDDQFGDMDARVACRQMGYVTGEEIGIDDFGEGTGSILLDEVDCTISDKEIGLCDHNTWGHDDCSHSEDVGLRCEGEHQQDIPDGTFKLVGGADSFGRVEVYHNGEWGTVCDDEFGMNEAHMICKSLGFSGADDSHCCAEYGSGSKSIFLDDLDCGPPSSGASSLFDCSHRGWGVNNCDHSEDVAVTCTLDTYEETAQNKNASCFEEGIDYNGADLTGSTCLYGASDPQQCQDMCFGLEDCTHFTWVPSSETYDGRACCWVKGPGWTLEDAEGVVSGPRECPEDVSNFTITCEPGYLGTSSTGWFNDKNIDNVDLERCIALCQRETDFTCLSIDWERYTNDCKLSEKSKLTHPEGWPSRPDTDWEYCTVRLA